MERRELRWELVFFFFFLVFGCRGLCGGSWVVCGDSNVTRYPTERSESNRITGAMAEFFSSINDLEFVDPPLFGGAFT